MYCRNCGNAVKDGAHFCALCGSSMAGKIERPDVEYIDEQQKNICSNCGTELKNNVKFCSACGTPVAPLKAKKIPLCLLCKTPLTNAIACENCGTPYKEDKNGYVEVACNSCAVCGAIYADGEAYCGECGADLTVDGCQQNKKLVPSCECGAELDLSSGFCTNCGKTNMKSSVKKVKPIKNGDTLTCPACQSSGMKVGRRRCFTCGIEFLPEPWTCKTCGKTNHYSFDECAYCHTGEAPVEIQKSTTQNQTNSDVPTYTRYTASQRTPIQNRYTMKWYYFLIYGMLFLTSFSYFISGIVVMCEDRILLGVLSLGLGVDALIVRGALKNYKSSAPGQWIGFLSLSYGINIVDAIVQYSRLSKRAAESVVGTTYMTTIVITAIAALIMIPCNAVYFNKRKDMFKE